jgi:uncharacterized protein YkwD/uncharacterized membrane protein required for colicin V production
MIDFVLGLTLAGLALRGWFRGFAREAMDLVGVVVGLLLAFRLGAPLGDELVDRFGIAPEAGRIIAAVIIFLLVGAASAVGAHFLSKALNLPGLSLGNRILGVGVSVATGLFILLLLVSLARVASLPDPVEGVIDESRVVGAVAAPESVPSRWFHALAGDRVVEAVTNLEREVGERRVVLEEGERATIPAAEPTELAASFDEARDVYDLVNRARLEAGGDPLAWSASLAKVARAHAREMYLRGYFSHRSPDTGSPLDRVLDAGIVVGRVGENLALAATPIAVHQGLMDSDGHRRNLLAGIWTRVGIGVVDGPYGLMVVEVFSD